MGENADGKGPTYFTLSPAKMTCVDENMKIMLQSIFPSLTVNYTHHRGYYLHLESQTMISWGGGREGGELHIS